MRDIVSGAYVSQQQVVAPEEYREIENINGNEGLTSNEKAVQTEVLHAVNKKNNYPIENVSQQKYIFSVQDEIKNLPRVEVDLASLSFRFLVDTGSTISLIEYELFNSLKSFLKYKFLSRQIKITTINSSVNFMACIELSFHIKGHFFKHPFFLIVMPEQPKFKGILGVEFLSKHGMIIDLLNNVIKYKQDVITVEYSGKNQVHDQIGDSEQGVENLDETTTSTGKINYVTSNNVNESVNDKGDDTHNQQDSENNTIFEVKLTNKIIIEPLQSVYAKVNVNMSNSIESFMVEHCVLSDNVKTFNSIHTNPVHKDTGLGVEDAQNDKVSCVQFYMLIENVSNNNVHMNKGQLIGYAYDILEMQDSKDNVNIESKEFVNLIQASPETLQLRKQEFDLGHFKLEHLTAIEKTKLCNLLTNFWSIFSKSLKSMGHTDVVIPKINFTQEYPMKALPFPIPQALQQEAKRQLEEMLEAGIISKIVSDWASPMLLVKKKIGSDGVQKYRTALDLRVINSVITQIAYPLPKIQDIVAGLAKYQYFTNLDLQQAYHQINLPEEYREKLAFTTPFGSFCYNRLIFGMKNSAAIFQSMIDNIIAEVNMQGIYAYQDDFVIGSNSLDETVEKLTKLFTVLEKYNLTLTPDKCNFHSTIINYLGFEISHNVVRPISSNIVKVTSFPKPKTKKQLKRFVGLCGFYRHLIPNYAEQIYVLNRLTGPNVDFVWDDACDMAFENLQKTFFNQPFLRQPVWENTFYLNTDASKHAIAACLLQKFDDLLLPVSYYSKTLSKSEQKYPAIKLELMAIVKGIQAFKFYLYSRKFVVLSDSQPLKFYRKISSPADITTRWLSKLAEYDFVFEYIKGQENVLPDYFSRIPQMPPHQDLSTNPELLNSHNVLPVESEQIYLINTHPACETLNFINIDNQDPLLEISSNTFLTEQIKDENLSVIYNSLLNGNNDTKYKEYHIDRNSKLLMFNKSDDNTESKIVVPRSIVPKVLRICHLTHLGLQKTYDFVTKKYFWKGAYTDTKNFVASCLVCTISKNKTIPQAPIQKTFCPKYPGEVVSLDLTGPFPNGYYVLTIIDIFSRHLELYPTRSITASIMADKIFKYITTYGRPSQILTDLGPQFKSEIFHHLNKTFGIRLIHTTTGRPQANAISERINQSIKATIQALQYEGKQFHHAVDLHKSIYNASRHTSTGFSPNMVHFARELSIITDTFNNQYKLEDLSQSHYLLKIYEIVDKVHRMVYGNIQTSQEKSRLWQHKISRIRKFKPQDMVYIKSSHVFNKKLTGPYLVKSLHGPVLCAVQRYGNVRAPVFKIHVDRLHLVPPRPQHLEQEVKDHVANNENTNNNMEMDEELEKSENQTSRTKTHESIPKDCGDNQGLNQFSDKEDTQEDNSGDENHTDGVLVFNKPLVRRCNTCVTNVNVNNNSVVVSPIVEAKEPRYNLRTRK
jgi:transposase InsO family protein